MRTRKQWLRAAAVMLTVVLLGVIAAVVWLGSNSARHFVERQASARLGRTIAIERMEIGPAGLELTGLSMSDPFAQTPAFLAEHARVELDGWALLAGRVEGSLRADAFELRVRKRGSQTNVHGLRRPPSSSRPLSLSLTLRGGHVVFIDEDRHEQIEAFGIELQSEFHREALEAGVAKSADIDLHAERLTVLGVSLDGVRVSLRAHDDRLELREAVAQLGGGSVRAAGTLAFTEASAWSGTVELKQVGLEAHVRPVIAVFFPALSGGDDEGLAGTVSLSAQLRGEGLEASAVSRSLHGQAHLGLHGVHLPANSVLFKVARALSETDAPGVLDALEIDAVVRRGWVRIETVRHRGVPVPLPIRGRARVSGDLDVEVDAVALLALVADDAGAWVQRYTTELKFPVSGSAANPTVGAPRPSALARGLLSAWTRRTFAPAAAVTP